VIDPVSQTLYLVAATNESGTNVQRLPRAEPADRHEPSNSGSRSRQLSPGTGDGGTTVTFDPLFQNQRPGLVLTSDGGVVIGWASHCDVPQRPITAG